MNKILPVLLSAGMGTRLSDQSKDIPKSLLKIHGEFLLSFQLKKLHSLGFTEVLIIVGFKFNEIQKAIGSNYLDMSIHYALNQDYSETGTAVSFFQAKEFWEKKHCSILMLHGDLFYDPSILDDLLASQASSTLLTDYNYQNLTNDEMVVFARNANVYKVEKGPEELTNSKGESLGINLFAESFCKKYFLYLEDFLADDMNKKFHWEQTIEGFLRSDEQLILSERDINKKPWININYSNDFHDATNNIYHKLYNTDPI